MMRFPRHRAAASLKPHRPLPPDEAVQRFPRHRAAASLKPSLLKLWPKLPQQFSAASGRGLIEAVTTLRRMLMDGPSFPRHRAAASLKHTVAQEPANTGKKVFRGIGPRPH